MRVNHSLWTINLTLINVLMNQIEAIKAYCAVYQALSFAQAAKSLSISTTMVSRYVKQLENELGCLLLKRNTRQVHVTKVGHEYYQQVHPVLTRLNSINQNMQAYSEQPKGKLVISSSIEFGGQYLAPFIQHLHQKYPDVELEINLSNQPVDIWDDTTDVALRVAPKLPGASYIAQPFCKSRLALWASPSYLAAHGMPNNIEALKQHSLLFFSHDVRDNQWLFNGAEQPIEVKLPWTWRSNNGRLLNEAAAQGQGIIQAPSYSVAQYVAREELVEIMPDYSINELIISAVYPHSYNYSISIKILIEELKVYFKLHPID